ncbi:biotin transporter BioY [Microbacterium sp. NPDC096154]|uniref:biotin transporter BioY n=1 Tax=Microbacterium sp. NPDC096154 TaxID=3155549 RepID=UPI0033227FE5
MAIGNGFDGRDLARVAVFAALIVVLGVAGSIPGPGGVPITAQTLGVMLAGVVLGPKRGAVAVAIVILLAAVGLPVLSGGRGGLGVFFGPTVGFLLGWLPGVVVAGLIARPAARRISWWRIAAGAAVGGVMVVYLVGIPLQAAIMGLSLPAAAAGSAIFLPGDVIKVVVATLLALALHRAYPRAFDSRADAAPARAAR